MRNSSDMRQPIPSDEQSRQSFRTGMVDAAAPASASTSTSSPVLPPTPTRRRCSIAKQMNDDGDNEDGEEYEHGDDTISLDTPAEDMEEPRTPDESDHQSGDLTVQMDNTDEQAVLLLEGETAIHTVTSNLQSSVPSYTPSSSSIPKPHRRTPSLLSSFASSPLRLALFPTLTPSYKALQSHPAHTQRECTCTSVLSPSSSSSSSVPAPDSIILASRLRRERDEAYSRLAFCALEHEITVDTLKAELEDLRTGKDDLKHDLEAMVIKLMEGEKMQATLKETTDALCQMESSYQQARGRLATANAELDDLRTHLLQQQETQSSQPESLLSASIPPTQQQSAESHCTCRSSIEEMRRETGRLEEEMEIIQRQHQGASNLVLSLQCELDTSNAKHKETRALLQGEQAISSSLHHQLEQARQTIRALQAEALVESQAHSEKQQRYVQDTTALEEALQESQLQLEGATNRTLLMQVQLDEQLAMAHRHAISERELRQRVAQLEDLTAVESHRLQEAIAQNDLVMSDRDACQSGLDALVLAHLQLRRDFCNATSQRQDQHLTSLDAAQADLSALSNMIVALAETAKESRVLKRKYDGEVNKCSRLCTEKEALAANLAGLHESILELDNEKAAVASKAEVDRQKIAELEATIAMHAQTVSSLQEQSSIKDMAIQSLNDDLAHLRESLRIAEEEGRNLVADFNMLSEELEARQSEEETRTAHTADTERRLAELAAQEEELRAQHAMDESELSELRQKLRTLETDLIQMQINVEETDDKYLESLKTIKKQSMLLDKLKVRNEALARANILLSQAMPPNGNNPLEPSSAPNKKRALPNEFIAPDPGPAAFVTASGSGRTDGRTASGKDKPYKPAETYVALRSADLPLSETQEQDRRLVSKMSEPSLRHREPDNKNDTVRSKDAEKVQRESVSSRTNRAPLAPVSGQKRLQPGSVPEHPSKTAQPSKTSTAPTMGTRTAFKPTANLASRPISKSGVSSDTRNLLAALHALKQPVQR